MQSGRLSKMLMHGTEKHLLNHWPCDLRATRQGRKMASFGAAAEPDDGHDSKELLAVEWVMNINID